MESKNSLAPLQKVISTSKYYMDACLAEDVSVTCINKKTKKDKSMPFKVLYDNNNMFWLQNEAWEYFLANEDLARIEERAAKIKNQWEHPVIVEPAPAAAETVTAEPAPAAAEAVNDLSDQGWGEDYEDFAAMPEEERTSHIKECKNRLDTLIAQRPRPEQLVTEALVETTRDAVMYNYASLADVMDLSEEDAKKHTHEMAVHTHNLVRASSELISENVFNNDLMNALVSKSNGTIIQHMTRVYLKGLAFLSYYNKLVSTSSIINKLRISFNAKYRKFYHALLPHLLPEDITLEKVFYGGMRAIPEETFLNWAVGFLVHDIGKATAIEYHEGEAAYNRDIVVEHVKVGYSSIMNKTSYPKDAGLITGYHHEYYGDPSGYGFYRTSLEQNRKLNPHMKLNACIAYDIELMEGYEALAFFPAKILEIVDVFDSLTDPNRKYRKVMTTEEALAVMQEDFINKHPKIDIILFDLFLKFIHETHTS